MTTNCKVTELFCIIDEFCKHFDAENAGNLLEDNSGTKRRRRQASLSDSEIMTILLYFHFGTFCNFKQYYLFFIKGTMKSYFPKAVSYNRFVELESRMFFLYLFSCFTPETITCQCRLAVAAECFRGMMMLESLYQCRSPWRGENLFERLV